MEPLRAVAPDVPGIADLVEVGRGGAGVVYRGRQVALGRDVAVKVVSSPGAPEAAVRRWRREVTAMARLSGHPGIVAVYDGGVTEDGRPYLVMPFLPGGTLDDRIRAEGRLPANEVRALGARLADALGAAHDAGVLHRDVKPSNVVISPYGEPQLADFGIAQLADTTATLTAGVHATVAFAAPEVLSGGPATAASDVYSLGATLHTCLTGEPPHGSSLGVPLVTLAMRVVHEPAADLRAAGVDPALAAVVERAMAKDPADRYADARAFGAALEGLGGGDAPEAPPTAVVPAAVLPTTPWHPADEPDWADPAPEQATRATAATAPEAPAPSPPAEGEPGHGSDGRRQVVGGPHDGRGGRRPALAGVLGVLAVLVLAGVLIAVVLGGDDGGDDGEDGAGAGEVAGETTVAPAPTTTAPRPTEGAGADLADAALAYVDALAAGDFDGAYAMTTEGFREAQPFDGYVDFWGGFGSIDVDGGPEVDGDAGTVTLRLVLDGAVETYQLELVRTDGGGFLIDGPRPR